MSKPVKEDCKIISIYKLREWGYLNGGYRYGSIYWTNSFSDKKSDISFHINVNDNNSFIRIVYHIKNSFTGEEKDVDQEYSIVTTPCNYGKVRYWFICSIYRNGTYCGRRVANLHLGAGGNYFACRHCYNLTYRSRLNGFAYSWLDIDEYEKKIKRWYYKGEPTRKHRQYLKMEQSSWRDLLKMSDRFNLLPKSGK